MYYQVHRGLLFMLYRICVLFVIVFVFLGLAGPSQGAVIYVDADAVPGGNGTSWNTAFATIEDGIKIAKDSDTVLVADGTYRGPGNRDLSFDGKAITVKSGNGPDRCIIDCEGTEDDPHSGFSFIHGETIESVLNGITITNGYASLGGGIYCDSASPTVMNCFFNGNTAEWGGGIFCRSASPTVKDCTFERNTASQSGGGIYCESASPVIKSCTFYRNKAEWGGGMYNDESSPKINKCTFSVNEANKYGGGLFDRDGDPDIEQCLFKQNEGEGGGGMSSYNSKPTVKQCKFYWNEASQWGGGMWNWESDPNISNSVFFNNSALWGGGISNTGTGLDTIIESCIFNGNHASDEGGGIQNEYSYNTIYNCIFQDNYSGFYGGALFHLLYGEAELVNCTLTGNSAMWGGAVYAEDLTEVTLSNSILWGNTALEGAQIGLVKYVYLYFSNCCVQGGREHIYSQGRCSITWDANSFDLNPKLTPDGYLQKGSPCIDAGNNELREDDVDPNDYPHFNNRIDIGATGFYDRNENGLPDWWEKRYLDNIDNIDPNDDPDQDTLTNNQEYRLYSSHPYRLPLRVPSNYTTIQEALDNASYTASKRDTVLVDADEYDGNLNLKWGKSTIVLAPNSATINCNDLGRLFYPKYGKGNFTVLQGFSIFSNETDYGAGIFMENSQFMLKDCSLEGNNISFGVGGMTCYLSNPTFSNLELKSYSGVLQSPVVGYIDHSNINLIGDLFITAGRLDVTSSWFYGEGGLYLSDDAILRITGQPEYRPTIIRTDVIGIGNIEIDSGQQLILEGDAIVNLSGIEGYNPDPNTDGHIIVNGSLIVRGNVTLESTNIDVKLFDVNTPNKIQYNNITLSETSAGFGGEFFVSENATIKCNNIISEGDRYLDLDPDPDEPNRPTISNNKIHVIIKQGKGINQGTLLELRAKDYDFSAYGTSGAHLIQDSEGFTEDPSKNWVLESLTLEPDSKLNLTNRQGFEYQDFNEPYPETIYVKELIMGPNSILNTALQTLYYQDLILTDVNGNKIVRSNGAQFKDIPLLGFSLGVIAMDDQAPCPHNEFDVRVRKRITDDDDDNPLPPSDPVYAGSIERVTCDPNMHIMKITGGFMAMQTQAPGKWPAKCVAAKGAFARVGDENITVEFEYLFRDDPYNEAELIVYLSDDPEVSRNLVPLARIRPPKSGRPGSIGSKRFAVFSGVFPRGALNFKRGTYIELELHGKGAVCWIDNWDPHVSCTAICGDYDTSDYKGINIYDYLTLVAENGLSNPADVGKGCLDLNNDGCVNIDDLQAWEGKGILNRCGDESNVLTSELRNPVRLTSYQKATSTEKAEDCTDLLIVGKPFTGKGKEVPESVLYCVSTDGNAVDVNLPGLIEDGRLVSDSDGKIYQVSCVNGLIHLDTATAVIEPNQIEQGNTTILVGFHDYDYDFEDEGFLLQDCVFDPRDSRIVYVVPVLVDQGNGPYAAAAKLQIIGDGKFNVLGTYGVDPASDPEQSIQKIGEEGKILLEPDMQHLQEIEIDAEGKYLYVLSRHIYNDNDRILVYDQENGPYPVAVCDVNIVAPTAMVLYSSKDKLEDRLYLASSIASLNDLTPQVHSFIVGTDKHLTYEKSISIDYPQPFYNFGLGIKAAITSMTVNSLDGTLYVTGFSAPQFSEESSVYQFVNDKFPSGPEIFPTSVLAVIGPGSESVQVKEINSGSKGLGLPFSILSTEK